MSGRVATSQKPLPTLARRFAVCSRQSPVLQRGQLTSTSGADGSGSFRIDGLAGLYPEDQTLTPQQHMYMTESTSIAWHRKLLCKPTPRT